MVFFKRNPWVAVVAFVVFLGGYAAVFSPPKNFSDSIVIIEQGTSVPEAAKLLADAHVVSHPTVLRFMLRILGKSGSVQSGAYHFGNPENLFAVIRRIVTGEYDLAPTRITITEGMTVRDIVPRIVEALPLVSAEDFAALATPYEGYLFPDTYFFPLSSKADAIVAAMRENFKKKVTLLSSDISASGHSLSEIIILASIIEKEVRTNENKKIVAGILWNRIAIGMPLQVDAVFGYIFKRDTYSPSFADLKVDSPYNTYTHKGLPPGPISNPGIESIEAALYPTKTDFLYYLTGKDGVMRYAKSFAQHQANRKKYLDI